MSQELQKYQPCGCVVCTCADDDRCHGCGAKHCGTHPIGEFSHPVYEPTPRTLTREQVERIVDALYAAGLTSQANDLDQYDAAHRCTIIQQAQEIERLQKSYDADMEHWTNKLTASEQEVGRLKATLEEVIRQCPYGKTPAERNIAKLAQRALKGA